MRALLNRVSVFAANITVSVALLVGTILTGKNPSYTRNEYVLLVTKIRVTVIASSNSKIKFEVDIFCR